MDKIMIMCRGLTHAQRCQRLLESRGIFSILSKAPTELTKNGCGYALILRRRGEDAIRILRDSQMLGGKLYRMNEDGWKEVHDDLP